MTNTRHFFKYITKLENKKKYGPQSSRYVRIKFSALFLLCSSLEFCSLMIWSFVPSFLPSLLAGWDLGHTLNLVTPAARRALKGNDCFWVTNDNNWLRCWGTGEWEIIETESRMWWIGTDMEHHSRTLNNPFPSQLALYRLVFLHFFLCSALYDFMQNHAVQFLHVLPPLKRMWRYLTPAYFSTISKSSAVFYLNKKKLHWNQSKPAAEQCNSGQCFILPPGHNSVGGTQYLGSWASTRRREKQCDLPTNQQQHEDGYLLALILLHAKQHNSN